MQQIKNQLFIIVVIAHARKNRAIGCEELFTGEVIVEKCKCERFLLFLLKRTLLLLERREVYEEKKKGNNKQVDLIHTK